MHLWRRDALAKTVTASHMHVCAAAAPKKRGQRGSVMLKEAEPGQLQRSTVITR